MSLVSLSDAQARVGAVTQDQIDEAEEQLAALIGPLTGERTETFYLSERRHTWRIVDGLWLSRRTSAVIVTHDGTQLTAGTDYRLVNSILIERIPDSTTTWAETMVATYSPNDEETLRSVIFDLLTYRQTPTGTQSIRIGGYSETYFPDGSGSTDPVMGALLRRVLPHAGMGLTSPFRFAAVRRDRTLIQGGAS
jgi:hypothetical protein